MPFLRNLPSYRSDLSADFCTWWLKRCGIRQECTFLKLKN